MTPRHDFESGAGPLEFGQIAALWSQEHGGRTRDETLQLLISAVWLRDFEDASGKTCLTLESVGGLDKSFNRRDLLTAMRSLPALDHMAIPADAFTPDSHTLPNGPFAAPWPSVRDKVPWQKLAALGLDQYRGAYPEPHHDHHLDTWLEPLSISKDDFWDWCSQRKLDPPEFWFERTGSAHKAPSPPASKRGRKTGDGAIDDDKHFPKMRALLDDEKVKSARGAARILVYDETAGVEGASDEAKIRRLCRKLKEWNLK